MPPNFFFVDLFSSDIYYWANLVGSVFIMFTYWASKTQDTGPALAMGFFVEVIVRPQEVAMWEGYAT